MYNEVQFSNEFKKKRMMGRYKLKRAKVRNKKIVKGLSVLAVVSVMAGGVVAFIPSMFKRAEALDQTKTESFYHDVDMVDEKNKKMETDPIVAPNSDIVEDKEKDIINSEDSNYKDEAVDDYVEPFFNVGNDASDLVEEFMYTDAGSYLFQYSSDYGVDPYIMASICMTETSLDHYGCCPGGENYSGYGVGYMQLESPSGQEITAYNYNTGTYDTEYITMDNACDVSLNIKLGCMIMQDSIMHFKGNQLLAIQSHNFGQGMTDAVLYYNTDDVDSLEQNYGDMSWVDWMEDAHYNPLKYLSDWEEDTYGGDEYVASVLSHCPVKTASYRYKDSNITIDLATGKVLGDIEFEKSR